MADFEVKSLQLTDQFTGLMASQADACASTVASCLFEGQLEWVLAPGAGWAGNPFDLDDITVGFPRDEPTLLYTHCLWDAIPGSAGEAVARKIEHDRIAAADRAYRMRHCSSIRATAHAAARTQGHSAEYGLLRYALAAYVQDMIIRGTGANT